jgi:hypothetical protein
MAVVEPRAPATICPECGSRNLLVVAVAATAVSHYCLGCERLFASDVKPSAGADAGSPARQATLIRSTAEP